MALPRNAAVRTVVRFPAQVVGDTGIDVNKANGIYTISLDIDDLAIDASPDVANDYLLSLDVTDNSTKRVLMEDVVSGAVTDFVATEIASKAPGIPGGRLTLTSGVAITTSDVTGAATVYYTPAVTDIIPIYDGTNWVATRFTERSLALDSTPAHSLWHAATGHFDFFLLDRSGTPTLVTGNIWTTNTVGSAARGTGASTCELELFNGIWVNKNSMGYRFGTGASDTSTIAARMATYVGTAFMTNNGQTEDSRANRYVWNAYNQVARKMRRLESTNTWAINTTGVYRQANGSTSNQLNFVIGLAGGLVKAIVAGMCHQAVAGGLAAIGIGVNSTTANSADIFTYGGLEANDDFKALRADYSDYPAIGAHSWNWLEYTTNGATFDFYGVDTNSPLRWRNGMLGDLMA